jgi:hypothetical protein
MKPGEQLTLEIWKLTVETLKKFSEPSPCPVIDCSTLVVCILAPCFHSQPQFCHWKWPFSWPLNQLQGTGSSLTWQLFSWSWNPLLQKPEGPSWCSEEPTAELRPKVVQISSHLHSLLLCDYPLSMPVTKLATRFCWFLAWLTLQPWRWR